MMREKRSRSSERHVALLRGINLAGNNRLSMKELSELFIESGCDNVSTYIQSGNVLFSAPVSILKDLTAVIARKIATRFGHRVPVILRSSEQMARTLSNNPFLSDGQPEKALHVYFLADVPSATGVQRLDPNRSSPDAFRVVDGEVYVYLPNGMARTKLTNAYFDSKLSTTSTARNWGTVCKLFEMMRE